MSADEEIGRDDYLQMTEGEQEAFRERQQERLDAAIREAERELNQQEQEALEILAEAEVHDRGTQTVELTGGQPVEVIDSLPGRLEEKASQLDDTSEMDDATQTMIDILTHLIQTNGFDSREVWQVFVEEYGLAALQENAMRVTEPYYERTQSFRGERR